MMDFEGDTVISACITLLISCLITVPMALLAAVAGMLVSLV